MKNSTRLCNNTSQDSGEIRSHVVDSIRIFIGMDYIERLRKTLSP